MAEPGEHAPGAGSGEPPERLGDRYEVVRFLGEGGFGRVYLAREPATGRPLAVKVVPARFAAHFDAQRPAHQRQRDLLDPGAARLFAVERLEDGTTLVVSEYVDGPDLGELLRDGPLPPRDALAVAASVAGALEAAHGLGLVHRDLTPKNVLVPHGGDGAPDFARAKLVDFGVAGELVQPAADEMQTVAGQVFGTPLYMAPEQLRGQPQTAATDVYGLGALLFALLYGRAPFEGHGSTLAVVSATLEREVELPPEPPLPAGLADLLRRCLAKDPADRPRTAPLVAALREALPVRDLAEPGGARAGAGDMHFRPRRTHPADSAAPAPDSSTAAAESGKGPPIPALLVAALAVVGVVFAALAPAPWQRLGAGVALVLVGVAVGLGVHRWLGGREDELGRRASRVLGGARASSSLSRTLAIEVDHLVERCRGREGQILGVTIAAMIDEYGAARDSSDRQAALMNTVDLVERLHAKASPWYVRHKEAVAVAVSLVGVAGGAVEIVRSVLALRAD